MTARRDRRRARDRRRHPRAPQGGPAPPHRRGPVRRRPRPARRPLAGDGPQPRRPRPHPLDRLRRAPAMPGVRQVPHRRRPADEWADPMPCAWPVTEDMKNPPHFPVAVDKACFVGDIVAVVVADSRTARPTPPKPSSSTTSRCRRSSTSKTPWPTGSSSTTTSARTRATRGRSAPTPTPSSRLRRRRPHRQRALRPAAAHPDGHGAPRRRASCPSPHNGDYTIYSATQIPHILKIMLGHHRRHPRAQDPRHRAGGRRRLRLASSTCTPRS